MVTLKQSTVIGVFRDYTKAEQAVTELRAAGFRADQIDFLVHARKDIKHRTRKRKIEEVVVTHGITGSVALGTESEVEEQLPSPMEPRILAKKGEARAALVGLNVPELEADIYDKELQAGHPLVVVRANGRHDAAYTILHRNGMSDMTSTIERERKRVEKERAQAEEKAARERTRAEEKARKEQEKARKEWEKEQPKPSPASSSRSRARTGGKGETVEVREEELRATKRPVQKGEVKIRKEVITETKTIDVPVTREEVVIERTPVRGRRDSSSALKSDEIRIPIKEDEVRVEKRPIVKEEVRVSKRQVQDTQRVSGIVRKERARVETTGRVKVTDTKR